MTTAAPGSRQQRNQNGPQVAEMGSTLSDDAQAYVDQRARLQREATTDPYLNGEDSRGRVKTGG